MTFKLYLEGHESFKFPKTGRRFSQTELSAWVQEIVNDVEKWKMLKNVV